MNDLVIKATSVSPSINFRANGLIEISGVSKLEDPESFFTPVYNWISEYVKNPAEKTIVNLDLEYYNTSSQLWLFKILELLADLAKIKTDVQLNWYYSDEDMYDAAKDLESLLHINFNFIKKPET